MLQGAAVQRWVGQAAQHGIVRRLHPRVQPGRQPVEHAGIGRVIHQVLRLQWVGLQVIQLQAGVLRAGLIFDEVDAVTSRVFGRSAIAAHLGGRSSARLIRFGLGVYLFRVHNRQQFAAEVGQPVGKRGVAGQVGALLWVVLRTE